MKNMKYIFSLMAFVVTFTAHAAQLDEFVDQKLASVMDKNTIPGVAVELYVDGDLHEYFYGYANKETKDPVTKKTIFELGSLSKIMTSLLFAQEIDWAKMALTDPLGKYIKEISPSIDKIKLQDLATHTSGLPFNLPNEIIQQHELKTYLRDDHVSSPAGSIWRYSNFGMGLLGIALENSTERSFDDLYRRHILNPLQMVVGVIVQPALEKYYAQGYDDRGEKTAHVQTLLFPGSASLKASASDMQKFLSAAIGLQGTPPRVFYPMRLTQSVFLKITEDKYQGLAWQIHPLENIGINSLSTISYENNLGSMHVNQIYEHPLYNGNALIDKTGSTNGFHAYIAVIPSKKSGIVILANKNISNNEIVKTARAILLTAVNQKHG